MTHFSQDSWEIYVRDKILQVSDVVRWLNEMALANPKEPQIVDNMLFHHQDYLKLFEGQQC